MDNYSFKQEHLGRVKYRDSDGRLHRIDGPAIKWYYGYKEWWIYGKKVTEEEFNKYMNSIFGIL